MNDLIISVGRECTIPVQLGVIEYPNEAFENQLYRLAVFITQDILDTYAQFSPWGFNSETTLEMALRYNFPEDWLEIARTSSSYHFRLNKVIAPYKFNLSNEQVTLIQNIIEFLCYEIIETTVINSQFKSVTLLEPSSIRDGILSDPVLSTIINQHGIIFVEHNKVQYNMIKVEDVQVSIKAMKLLRIFAEEYLHRLISKPEILTLSGIKKYFNITSVD